MKILFVMPLALPAYMFQLAALSSFLKSNGHNVRYEELIIDNNIEDGHLKQVKAALEEFKPDMVGFSSYEMSFNWIEELASYIKSLRPGITIIVGGYLATLSPEEVLSCPWIDAACIGEGERPLKEALDSLKGGRLRKDIKNLWVRDNDKIVKNELRDLISDLDELPFMDREIFTSDNRKSGVLEIMASRGCPYECSNCANHALKKIYSGKGPYVRYRSAENVLGEIEACLKNTNFKIVQFDDDMFTANRKWLADFCLKYKARVGLPFMCNIRPESGVDETLRILKDAGCAWVSIGVEAGDESIRREVLGRAMPDTVIIQAFRNAKRMGIKRKSFNMVGLPYETSVSLWKTIWLNLRIAPDSVQTSVYYPFKGTLLGDLCYKNGWVNLERKRRLKLYANDSILDLPTVSRTPIRLAKWANSATVLRSGNITAVKAGLRMLAKRFSKGRNHDKC